MNKYVYVASSWRNDHQPNIIEAIRALGIECYDFKDSDGFHWKEAGLEHKGCTFDEYIEALGTHVAARGFARDMAALVRATHVLLVLPSGRSAHLEAGYAIGADKRTLIYIPPGEFDEPELMYLMAGGPIDDWSLVERWLLRD